MKLIERIKTDKEIRGAKSAIRRIRFISGV